MRSGFMRKDTKRWRRSSRISRIKDGIMKKHDLNG
jgi:hypothetical protein